MDETTVLTLLGIAGVAATFAGFSGVVAVFGRRAHGEWFLEDRFRLTNMLVTSLGACLLAFIPILAILLHLDGARLWAVSSTSMCVYCTVFIVYILPRWTHLVRLHPGVLSAKASVIVLVSSFLAAVLQALNAASLLLHREAGPYVLGLVLLLVIAGLQFALLILRPLSAHQAHVHQVEEKMSIRSERDS